MRAARQSLLIFFVLAAGNGLAWYLLVATSGATAPEPISHRLTEVGYLLAGLILSAGISFLFYSRKHAAAELERSEQRFRDFAEAAGDWFWETGPDHRFTFMSRTPTGGSASSYLGLSPLDLVAPEPDPGARERHREDLEGQRPFRDFTYARRHDADEPERWIRSSGKPYYDSAGRFLGHRGVASDITETLAMRQEAARATSRLLHTIELIPEGLALYDRDDRLVICNNRYREMYPMVADLILPGVEFEHLAREAARRNAYDVPAEQIEAFVAERLAAHRRASGLSEHRLHDGRWIQVNERRTEDGNLIGVWTDVTEIKQREEAVRESDERFRAMANNIPGMVFRAQYVPGHLVRYQFVSDRTRDLFGVEPLEALADAGAIHECVLPEDRPLVVETVKRSAETLQTWDCEFRIRDRRGDMKWVRGVASTRVDDRGTIVWEGMCQDITEQKRSGMALRESEDRFRGITANLPGTVYRARFGPEREMRYEFVSEGVRELFGLDPAQLIADHRAVFPFLHPEDKTRLLATAVHAAANLQRWECEFRILDRQGRMKWIRSVASARRDEDGTVIWDGIALDITDRKQSEAALQESEERYALAMQGSNEGLWHMDLVSGEVYIAPRLAAMIGIEEIDPFTISARYHERVHRDDQARRRHTFEEHVAGNSTIYHCEYRIFDSTGNWRWVVDRGLAQRDDFGRAFRMAGSVSDITARKNYEEELRGAKELAEIANRTKSEFLANVSHELRTPLNAVIGFSHIIRDELLGPVGIPKYREYANDINASGAHLLAVINDILDVAKIEAGKVELSEELIDVAQAAEAALRLVKQRADEATLALECNMPKGLPRLRADGRKLKQILINLLSNSVKFTPAGGSVSLSAEMASSGDMIIRVRDTGIGIAAEDIPKALSPFGQVDSKLNRRYEGTGLGLTLVQSLIQLHGGSVDLRSEVGTGTTVAVSFPAERIIQ